MIVNTDLIIDLIFQVHFPKTKRELMNFQILKSYLTGGFKIDLELYAK